MPAPLPPLPPVVRTGEQPATAPAPEPAAQWRPITVSDVIAAMAYVACAVVMIFCLMEATTR